MCSNASNSVLGRGGADDAERLSAIASAADINTTTILESLKLPDDAAILDVGCGTGSIAAWAAHHIAPRGAVIALDQDLAPFRASGVEAKNLTAIECDVRKYVPVTQFDVIHSRFVLSHLGDRASVISQLVARLTPGGCLVVTEPVVFPMTPRTDPAVRRVFEAYHQWAESGGMSLTFGAEVPGIALQLGASTVSTRCQLSRYGGGPGIDKWSGLIEPVADYLHEVTSRDLERFRELAQQSDTFEIPQAIVTTTAHFHP